jgi:hypothetical protein
MAIAAAARGDRRGLVTTEATKSATEIEMVPGSHCTTAPKRTARSAFEMSDGKLAARKKTAAYKSAIPAKAWRRLPNQIAWQPLRARA